MLSEKTCRRLRPSWGAFVIVDPTFILYSTAPASTMELRVNLQTRAVPIYNEIRQRILSSEITRLYRETVFRSLFFRVIHWFSIRSLLHSSWGISFFCPILHSSSFSLPRPCKCRNKLKEYKCKITENLSVNFFCIFFRPKIRDLLHKTQKRKTGNHWYLWYRTIFAACIHRAPLNNTARDCSYLWL